MHPEVVADKGELRLATFALLGVKQVSSADEWLLLAPVAVHAVEGNSLLLFVNRDSLVQPFLVKTHEAVSETQVLVFALQNFDRVGIHLLD